MVGTAGTYTACSEFQTPCEVYVSLRKIPKYTAGKKPHSSSGGTGGGLGKSGYEDEEGGRQKGGFVKCKFLRSARRSMGCT